MGLSQNLASSYNNNNGQSSSADEKNTSNGGGGGGRVTSKTAPARLEVFDDESDETNALKKVLLA